MGIEDEDAVRVVVTNNYMDGPAPIDTARIFHLGVGSPWQYHIVDLTPVDPRTLITNKDKYIDSNNVIWRKTGKNRYLPDDTDKLKETLRIKGWSHYDVMCVGRAHYCIDTEIVLLSAVINACNLMQQYTDGELDWITVEQFIPRCCLASKSRVQKRGPVYNKEEVKELIRRRSVLFDEMEADDNFVIGYAVYPVKDRDDLTSVFLSGVAMYRPQYDVGNIYASTAVSELIANIGASKLISHMSAVATDNTSYVYTVDGMTCQASVNIRHTEYAEYDWLDVFITGPNVNTKVALRMWSSML